MTRLEEMREWARKMIERESRGNGDQINALDRVARSVGAQPRSIRRLINGETKDPGLDLYFKIRDQFLAQMRRMITSLENELRAAETHIAAEEVKPLHDELEALAEKVRQAKGK